MNIDVKNKIDFSTSEVSNNTNSKSKTEDGQSFGDFLNENNLILSNGDYGLLQNMLSIYEMPYDLTLNTAQSLQGIQSSFVFDTMNISKEDAMFFANMFDENLEITYTPASPQSFVSFVNEVEQTRATSEVSKTLLNLIEKAYNTSKPCRIDFDNNISVILQIDKDGKVTAQFLPSDAVAEQYLRNNIGYLRQSLDAQNIEYNEISYRTYKDNNGKQQKSKQGEEDE